MPELDYMVLADYVRQDGGSIHIMGAGVDTVAASRTRGSSTWARILSNGGTHSTARSESES